MKPTKPAEYYELFAPNQERMEGILRAHGLGDENDVQVAQMGVDAATYASKARGGTPIDALVDPSTYENPEDHAFARELLTSVDFSSLSGEDLPIDRGVAFAAAIKGQGGKQQLQKLQKDNPAEFKKKLQQLNQQVQSIQQMKGGKKGGVAQKVLGLDGPIPEIKLPSLTAEEKRTLEALAIIQRIGGLKAKPIKSAPKFDPNGRNQRYRMMEDYNELSLIDPTELLLPDGEIRLLNMEFEVPESIIQDTMKQFAWIHIDRSGSMHSDWKQGYVKAVLLHFFERLGDGSTELFVSTFEKQIDDPITRLRHPDQALEWYKKYHCAGGSITEVGEVIKEAQRQIQAHKIGKYTIHQDARPEMVVINDGQDDVDPTIPTKGEVHAVVLEAPNEDLETLCKNSGGTYNLFQSGERRWFE